MNNDGISRKIGDLEERKKLKQNNLFFKKQNMKKKSLSVKKKIHKSFLKYLKNSKINNLFKEFNNKLDILLNKEFRFAIAVSGGPDSLALAFLAKIFSIKYKLSAKFFIVDHKLRPESTVEAKKIKKLLSQLSIKIGRASCRERV